MLHTILIRKPGQTIARPFQRASSTDELVELIESFVAGHYADTVEVRVENLNTETPVARIPNKGDGWIEFFAFSEMF